MDPRIRLILRLIAEHDLSARFSLAQPSKWLGLSEAYLMRLFHREVGKPLRGYLLEARMSKAAQLLKDCPRPIKQVALECGYGDVSNFYRDFKNSHAATPREMSRNALAAIEAPLAISPVF